MEKEPHVQLNRTKHCLISLTEHSESKFPFWEGQDQLKSAEILLTPNLPLSNIKTCSNALKTVNHVLNIYIQHIDRVKG